MAFRSIIALATAAALWYASPAKAEDSLKPVGTATASIPSLELKLQAPPLVDLQAIECPPSTVIDRKQPLIFEDGTGIEIENPRCALSFPDLETITEESSPSLGYRHTSAGVKSKVTLELPGTDEQRIRYQLFGINDGNNQVNNGKGRIAFGISHSDIFWRDNQGNNHEWDFPRLSLDYLFVGNSTLPALIKNISLFPAAREKLETDLESLVNNVTSTLGNRQAEIFFDWGGFFRDLLPKYTTSEGVIKDWNAVRTAVKDKAKEYYGTLSETEQQSLDGAINTFETEFTNLQNNNALAKTAWGIINAEDPFCQLRWGSIPFCEAYQMLKSLGPELVDIKVNDGRAEIILKDLKVTMYAFSADSHSFTDDRGRELTLTDYRRIRMQGAGGGWFRGWWQEGADLETLFPGSKYQDELALIGALLGKQVKAIDGEAHLQLSYNLSLISERMAGFMSSFPVGNHRLGMVINHGTEYHLNSSGYAAFSSIADSDSNLLLAEFNGSVILERTGTWRQDLAIIASGLTDNWWYNANLSGQLTQNRRLTEVWGASLRYIANWQGKETQNSYSLLNTNNLDDWNSFEVDGRVRTGITLSPLDLFLFTDFRRNVGGGFFVSEPYFSFSGQCESQGSCKAKTRIPIIRKLNPEQAREHEIILQELEDSPLVGKEALEQDKNRDYDKLQPGIFFDGAMQHFFVSRYPYSHSTSASIGFLVVPSFFLAADGSTPETSGNYGSVHYLGNFVDMHGIDVQIGGNYWYGHVAWALAKDHSRVTNTTTAELELAVRLGSVDIVNFLELYPADQDTNPVHEEDGSDNYKPKQRGDFRLGGRLRGDSQILEEVIAAIPRPNLRDLETRLSSNLGSRPFGLTGEATLAYAFGNLSLFHELIGGSNLDHEITLRLVGESHYNLINGFGLAAAASTSLWNDETPSWLLPGIGYDRIFGDHHLRGMVTIWYSEDQERVFSNARFRYTYETSSHSYPYIAPYFRVQASSRLNWHKESALQIEDKGSSVEAYGGGKIGPVILAFKPTLSSGWNWGVGLVVGIDHTYFIEE